jgi:two-component system, OmpR family, phosphate regulon response regulator PhoB
MKTVLVVEDDQELRTVFRFALKNAGYRVVDVEDGGDALRHVEHEAPSAVVLDLGLPRVSGRDVQRELAAGDATRRIPIVVVTGTATDDLDEKDFAAILHKPVHVDTVVEVVDHLLRYRSGRGAMHRP